MIQRNVVGIVCYVALAVQLVCSNASAQLPAQVSIFFEFQTSGVQEGYSVRCGAFDLSGSSTVTLPNGLQFTDSPNNGATFNTFEELAAAVTGTWVIDREINGDEFELVFEIPELVQEDFRLIDLVSPVAGEEFICAERIVTAIAQDESNYVGGGLQVALPGFDIGFDSDGIGFRILLGPSVGPTTVGVTAIRSFQDETLISSINGDSDDIVLSQDIFFRVDSQVVEIEVIPNPNLGDVNGDGSVSTLDVAGFVELITSGTFLFDADINKDNEVNLLDVAPFVDLLQGN